MRRLFIKAFLILGLAVPFTAQAGVSVSPTGAASYSVPIEVPPGVNGMQPQLSINYNSQGGNGLLGMGWNLSGLSVIHRCARTVAQDGVKGGINLDANDRFCLDGQRLINTSGAYGADGTVYRTEIESFARITSSGAAGTGPASFTVETKDGKIMEYGVTADSRIEAQGKTTVLTWALNRVSDRYGNEVTFSYTEDNPNGHYRIDRIDYAGNSVMTTTPKASVRFVYESRTDNAPGYIAGSKYSTPVRMKNMKTYATIGVTEYLVRDYRLAYQYGTATGRSRLIRSTEYDSLGNARAPHTFTWREGGNGGFVYKGLLAPNSDHWADPTAGDWNGDGRMDFIIRIGIYWYSYLSNGNGTFTRVGPDTNPYYGNEKVIGDWNADGKTDFIAYAPNSGWYLFTSNGNGTFAFGGAVAPYSYQGLTAGDWNADGRTDFIIHTGSGWAVYESNGNGTFTNKGVVTPWYHVDAVAGDWNGDGRMDFMAKDVTYAYRSYAYLSNGNGTFTRLDTGFGGYVGGNVPGDWNGDGMTDVIINSQMIFLSDGDGTFTSKGSATSYTGEVRPADLNGDGRMDFVVRSSPNQSQWFTYHSNGNGTFTNKGIIATHPYSKPLAFGDWDGDGLAGYLYNYDLYENEEGWRIYTSNNPNKTFADTLSTVTNPMGVSATLSYKPLTDTSVYTQGTGFSAAIYVVSQVSQDDGVGGQRVTTYKYGEMKSDISRGNLGFAWLESTDVAMGVKSYTSFNQSFPYIGRVNYSEQKLSNGTLISRTDNSFTDMPLNNGKTHFPYVSQKVVKSYEINDGTSNPISTDTTTTVYDDYGNATSISEAKSDGSTRVVSNIYSNDTVNWLLGRLTQASVTSTPVGQPAKTRTSGFGYNTNGVVIQEVVEPNDPALKLITDYGYDGFGNRTSSTVSAPGETARVTSTVYDAQGQFPVSTTNAMGHSESYLWDARFGVKTSLTGPNGLTTSWSYDGFGRKTAEGRADGTSTTITYHMDAAPFYVTSQSTGSPAKTTYYDSLGRKTRVEGVGFSGSPVYVDTEYNALGQVDRKSGPYSATPKWTTFAYDAIGRATSQTKPDGATTTTTYNGLTTTVTNAKSQVRTEIKDVHGRVYQVIDAMGGTLTYSYDAFGNLIATTDHVGNVVSMSYDLRGRKTGMDDPDMGVWSYAYNAFGELISQTNARGQTATMTYDALGRMKTRTEPEGSSSWTYDVGSKAIGKLSSEAGPGGYAKSYYYDAYGRPSGTTSTILGNLYSMSTAYDANGRVDTVTYPTGFAVQRLYNASGYLSQLRNAAAPSEVFWTANTVDAEGHVLQETLGSGVTTNRQYNSLSGRLESITAGSIQSLTLTYDDLGNLLSRSDGVMAWTEGFTYDSLNRITGVSGPANKTYAYDAIGNITSKSDVGAYAYNDPNHVHAVTSAGGNSYTYDANGNMLSGAGRSLSWTSFDRPSLINSPGGSLTLTYDANHRRISKSVFGGETTVYVNEAFEEVTLAGVSKAKHYIRSGNGLIAIMEQVNTVKTMKYVHNDQLGSINVITDAAGAVLERLSFDAFGKPRHADGTDATPPPVSAQTTRGYTGHKMDAEVGLINMNARLYDPILGRFISADVTIDAPQDMQTYNRYTYVINNPFAHTDPTGNWSWKNFWKAAKPVVIVAATVAVATITGGAAAAAYASAQAAVTANAVGYWAVATGYGAAAAMGTTTAAMIAGAVGGAFAGMTASALSGGNLSEIATASLMGGITGGVAGWIHGMDLNWAERAVAHGGASAGINAAFGMDPGQGFISGFSGGMTGWMGPDFGGGGFGGVLARTAMAGSVGGLGSRLVGGRFIDGFRTAAYMRLFNHEGYFVETMWGRKVSEFSKSAWGNSKESIYRGAQAVEEYSKPISTTLAYGALKTRNPLLIKAAAISSGIGVAAIGIQNVIHPDMHQAVDQINSYFLEVMLPKQLKPFTGYVYDTFTGIAGSK